MQFNVIPRRDPQCASNAPMCPNAPQYDPSSDILEVFQKLREVKKKRGRIYF